MRFKNLEQQKKIKAMSQATPHGQNSVMKLVEQITDSFIQQKVIAPEERELYLYGLDQFFFQLLNFATALLIAFFSHQVWECIIFLVAYIPLRSFAGGYHAKTQTRCYFLSTFLVVVALGGICFVPWNPIHYLLVMVGASLVVACVAPVPDHNKPLNAAEVRVYRKRTWVILAAEWVVVAGALALHLTTIVASIGFALVILSMMLFLGILKNKKCTHAQNQQEIAQDGRNVE